MATKRGRMVNYFDGLLAISPITLWPRGFVKPRDKLKQLYLHLHRAYCGQNLVRWEFSLTDSWP